MMPLRRLHALAPSLALLAAAAVASCISPQRPDGGKGLLPEGARAPLLSGTDQGGARVKREKELLQIIFLAINYS